MAYERFDSIAPKELLVPIVNGGIATTQPSISGALFISGAKLFFMLGNSPKIITSA